MALLVATAIAYAPPVPVTGPPPLQPLAFEQLPLGTFTASGWLLRQLVQQANTLSGHLSLFWPDVNDSVWVGGRHDHAGG